jgi:hypothetical protein
LKGNGIQAIGQRPAASGQRQKKHAVSTFFSELPFTKAPRLIERCQRKGKANINSQNTGNHKSCCSMPNQQLLRLQLNTARKHNALQKGKLLQEKNMLAVFCSPSRYTQGKNATASLGEEMAYLGLDGPALVVAGRPPIRLLGEIWKQTFNSSGIKHTIHPFGGECSLAVGNARWRWGMLAG